MSYVEKHVIPNQQDVVESYMDQGFKVIPGEDPSEVVVVLEVSWED